MRGVLDEWKAGTQKSIRKLALLWNVSDWRTCCSDCITGLDAGHFFGTRSDPTHVLELMS